MALPRFAADEGPFAPLPESALRSLVAVVSRGSGRLASSLGAVRLDGEPLETPPGSVQRPRWDHFSMDFQWGMEASDDTHVLRDAQGRVTTLDSDAHLSREVLGCPEGGGFALHNLLTEQRLHVAAGRRFVAASPSGQHALIAQDEGFVVAGFDGAVYTHGSGDPVAIAPDGLAVAYRDGDETFLLDVPEGRVRAIADAADSQLEFHDLGALFRVSGAEVLSIWDEARARWHELSPATARVCLHRERWLVGFTTPDGRARVWAGGAHIIDLGEGQAVGFLPVSAVRRLETLAAPRTAARLDHRGALRARPSDAALTVRRCLHNLVKLEDWSVPRRSPTNDDPTRIEKAFRDLRSAHERLERQLEAHDGGEWEVREGHLVELRSEMATACEALTYASDAAIEAHLETPAWARLAGRLLHARREVADDFHGLTDVRWPMQVAALNALAASELSTDDAAGRIERAFDALSEWPSRQRLLEPHRALTTLRRHIGFVRPRVSEMLASTSDPAEQKQMRAVLSDLGRAPG